MGGLVTVAGIVIGVLGVAVVASEAWTYFRGSYAIDGTETTVADTEIGQRVVLRGEVEPREGSFTSALGRDPYTVVSCWLVETFVKGANHSQWGETAAGIDAEPFVIDDGSGRALVRLGSASGRTSGSTVGRGVTVGNRWCEFAQFPVVENMDADGRTPRHVETFHEQTGAPKRKPSALTADGGVKRRRYSEGTLTAGDTATVVGTVQGPPEGTDADVVLAADGDDALVVADRPYTDLRTGLDTSKHLAIAGVFLFAIGVYVALEGLPF